MKKGVLMRFLKDLIYMLLLSIVFTFLLLKTSGDAINAEFFFKVFFWVLMLQIILYSVFEGFCIALDIECSLRIKNKKDIKNM